MPPGGTEDNLRLGVFRRVLKTLKAGENLLSPPLLQSSGTDSLYRQEKDGGGRGPAREVLGNKEEAESRWASAAGEGQSGPSCPGL